MCECCIDTTAEEESEDETTVEGGPDEDEPVKA